MARPTGNLLRRPSPGDPGSRRGLFQFFGEVVSELRKVTWPTRRETTRLTMLVLAVAATIGVALGFIDLSFTRLLDQFLF